MEQRSPSHKATKPDAPAGDDWYKDGLAFACTQCGNCCTGAPGYVFVTAEEIDKIAACLGRPGRGLGSEHLRRVGSRFSLTESPASGDCCFLQSREAGRTCRIYPVRPLQCRTWPFWKDNLSSPGFWEEAARNCPGMNRGRLYSLAEIRTRLRARSVRELPSE